MPASGAPSATAARTRRSVSDSPSRVAGYSRLSRSKASPRNRSSPDRVAAMAARPSGVGARKAAHARTASCSAAGVRRAQAFGAGQLAQLVGGQLAEAAESGDAGVLADADQGDALRRHAELGQAGEDLDDLQLVVQVRLEPQHVLAVAGGLQGPVPLGEHVAALAAVVRAGVDEELGPDPAQLARAPPPAPVLRAGRRASTGPATRARSRQVRGVAVADVQGRGHPIRPPVSPARRRATACGRPSTTRRSWPCGRARAA